MLLNPVAHYNDLSKKLREELVNKVKSFGKSVTYRFDISKPNPDPTHYGGILTIWPTVYTLTPTVFPISDPYEERDGKSKTKNIALIEGIDEKGLPNRFKKIKIHGRRKGLLQLDLENEEQFNMALCLEMHPKLRDGKFKDPTKRQMFDRVDEQSAAMQERKERTDRKKAMDAAENMTLEEVQQFADAMVWDSSENEITLRNRVEELAENSPSMFNDLISSPKLKLQGNIKRALDKKIWNLNGMECRLSWTSTGQPIVVLGLANDGSNDIQRLAEWFMTAGKQADDVMNKFLALEGKKIVEEPV